MESCRPSVSQVIEGSVRRVAGSSGVVDKVGQDSDDYHQLFSFAAWFASRSTPDHGENVYERWAFTAVRNRLKTCRRTLVRAPDRAQYDEEIHLQETLAEEEAVERLDQRGRLQKLRRVLEPEEWQLLQDYVVHGCNAASVWRAYDKPTSCRWFCRNVRVLLKRCRQIILEM